MMDTPDVTRREMLATALRVLAAGSLAGAMLPTRARASEVPLALTVYKDPSCGCCAKWVTYMRENGFAPNVTDRTDMAALKDSIGIPVALRSCHTALAGKYLIEGHVPAGEVRRLLATAPRGLLGLAVPGMPSGSPGMEGPARADQYSVIAFAANGSTSVFARHG